MGEISRALNSLMITLLTVDILYMERGNILYKQENF